MIVISHNYGYLSQAARTDSLSLENPLSGVTPDNTGASHCTLNSIKKGISLILKTGAALYVNITDPSASY